MFPSDNLAANFFSTHTYNLHNVLSKVEILNFLVEKQSVKTLKNLDLV